MSQIAQIIARQIFDSRGNPTIEVEVITNQGIVGRASVPAGSTAGKYEAKELRDNDKGHFGGLGVNRAVANVNKIVNEELNGFFVSEQSMIDAALIELDGTENKSNLGANAMLGVSLAVAKAAAKSSGQPLYKYIGGVNATTMPMPMINILSGGTLSDNKVDIQDFMIVPAGARSFSEAMKVGVEVARELRILFRDKHISANADALGVLTANLESNDEAAEYVVAAIINAGYKPGENVFMAIDAAASQIYNPETKTYFVKSEDKSFSTLELIGYWEQFAKKFPIISIEDGLDQDDWEGWFNMNQLLGNSIQLAGDDIFATNVNRLIKGITEGAANAILIKPNQIGTLTETLNAVALAHRNGFTCIVSSRSGETEDTSIADLAVALNTGSVKLGSILHSEFTSKYNRLLRIEEMLGAQAKFGYL